jgi:chemotaxis protein methyltransferase CheR
MTACALLSPADHFRRLARERTGLNLEADKDYLFQSRLAPIARAEGFPGVEAVLAAVARQPDGPLAQACLDAMATHESFFFRDGTPFDQLRDTLFPRLISACAAKRRLRLWSAACSSGQEPYSIAMLLKEAGAALAGWRVEILATDISAPVLAKAKAGRFSDFEVRRGLSSERRDRWMSRDGSGWIIRPEIRAMVDFQRHNLMNAAPQGDVFDLILCRNVLIYFDMKTKSSVLDMMANALAPHGSLVLGGSETIVGLTNSLNPSPGLRGVFEVRRHAKTSGAGLDHFHNTHRSNS